MRQTSTSDLNLFLKGPYWNRERKEFLELPDAGPKTSNGFKMFIGAAHEPFISEIPQVL